MTGIRFTHDVVFWHIILLAVIVIICSFLEWKRKKRNRTPRILAIIFALSSLYFIYLRPVISIEKDYKSVVLIGENLPESIAEYTRKFSEYEVLSWDKATHLLKSGNGKRTYSFKQLAYAIDTLFVRGYLPPINPAYYNHMIFVDTTKTIHDFNFPDRVYLGDTITLKIKNKSDETIILEGNIAQDTIESQSLKPDADFIYDYIPKISGYVNVQIKIDEEENYNFSSLVEDRSKYVFHLLAETPDFEWRFLKNFLTAEGHAVYLKSKISRNKFKSDFSNWPDSLKAQMQSEKPLFNQVLITDMQAWNNLSVLQKSNYMAKLKEVQGVLLIRANTSSSLSLGGIHKEIIGNLIASDNHEDYYGAKALIINNLNGFEYSKDLAFNFAVLP